MKKTTTLLLLSFFAIATFAQKKERPYPKSLTQYDIRQKLNETSLLNALEFDNIGPTIMSGRITDLEVSPKDPSHFYVAYASGGLWYSESNGTHFSPIFDNQAVMTIGDIAVNWKEDIIWVGTGENNSSRSSYAGNGIYKSVDKGKNWQWMGLPESHHIGRIILHPSDKNTLWVAVVGHLYTPNKERGIYKTTDGGATWKQVLFVDENSGAIDLIQNPYSSNELYAATWHRERRAWNFVESGEGSGLYKSVDGGETWKQINTKESGFPSGEGVGRIGLDIGFEGRKTVIYALLDNQFRRPKEDKKSDDNKTKILEKDDLRNISKADFLKLEAKQIEAFLKENRFPKKYTVETILEMVKTDKIKPNALVEYLEDANSLLFDTPVIGAELYRSEDGGSTWQKTHEDYLEDIYYSYGYYFGQVRVNPSNAQEVYIMGVPILASKDGGKTFENINGENVHVDHHALWVNPNRQGHLINGNDGGLNISYDYGKHWFKCNTPMVGQFYTVNVDMATPYNVYGGLQDNGVWVGSHQYKANTSWQQEGQYPYKRLMGGDGFKIEIDPRDNNTVYTGYQFGNYFRINKTTGQSKYITPKHELGERPLRWNWQTPIHLSKHNPDILYMGANKVYRSFNQGDDFSAISKDLTKGGKKGDVAFGTLTDLHESDLKFGLLYAGSDDGLVHVSKDGGNTWKNISKGLPKNKWVSRVRASSHDEATVYISLNGYRDDDFKAYVFKSTNYGKSWKQIGKDLPHEPVNVIKEDPMNPNLLYVGTDHGLYISLNQGKTFMGMNNTLPDAPIHDLVIHPRENDLIIGTHGRSIYKTNVSAIQSLTPKILTEELFVWNIKDVAYSGRWGNSWSKWLDAPTPQLDIPFYVNSDETVQIKIIEKESQFVLFEQFTSTTKGINLFKYDFIIEKEIINEYNKLLEKPIKPAKNGKIYMPVGEYIVEMTKNGWIATVPFVILKEGGQSVVINPKSLEREED